MLTIRKPCKTKIDKANYSLEESRPLICAHSYYHVQVFVHNTHKMSFIQFSKFDTTFLEYFFQSFMESTLEF